jgi:hypothetical protein
MDTTIYYNIDNEPIIDGSFTINNSLFVIWAYKDFKIESSNASVAEAYYSIDGLTAHKADNTTHKHYTVVFYKEFETIDVKLTCDMEVKTLTIKYRDTNIIEFERQNLHYKDILYNKNLPEPIELVEATFTKSDFQTSSTFEEVKRLLIDQYRILSRKGNKTGIEYFFNMVGLKDVTVISEFVKDNGMVTLNPDTLNDIKTGNYHVLYYNFEHKGYDKWNLPIRYFIFQDIERFKHNLINAIVIANTNFTSIEQEIVFFGIVASSNAPRELSIASLTTQRFYYDVLHFRRELNINLIHHQVCPSVDNLQIDVEGDRPDKPNQLESVIRRFLIYDSSQMEGVTAPRSEVKYLQWDNNVLENDSLMTIYDEVFDETDMDTLPSEWIHPLRRKFGCILHLSIESPKSQPATYISCKIKNLEDDTTIGLDERLVNGSEKIYLQFFTAKEVSFQLDVTCKDLRGSKESYTYIFKVKDESTFIDFDLYSSFKIDPNVRNDINMDTDSPSQISYITDSGSVNEDTNYYKHFTLHIPNEYQFDLRNYFDNDVMLTHPFQLVAWWQAKDKYQLPKTNYFHVASNISDTIPMIFTEAWVDVLSFIYIPEYTLKLRIYDYKYSHKIIIIDFWELSKYGYGEIDKLFVSLIDVVTNFDEIKMMNETDKALHAKKETHYFISINELGLDLGKGLYDFVLVDSNDTVYHEIYDTGEFIYNFPKNEWVESKFVHEHVPVNYDYPLIIKSSDHPTITIPKAVHKSLKFYDYIKYEELNTPGQTTSTGSIYTFPSQSLHGNSQGFAEINHVRIGNYIYCVGEWFGALGDYNLMYRYNVSNKTWKRIDLPNCLMWSSVKYLNGKLFVIGSYYLPYNGSGGFTSDPYGGFLVCDNPLDETPSFVAVEPSNAYRMSDIEYFNGEYIITTINHNSRFYTTTDLVTFNYYNFNAGWSWLNTGNANYPNNNFFGIYVINGEVIMLQGGNFQYNLLNNTERVSIHIYKGNNVFEHILIDDVPMSATKLIYGNGLYIIPCNYAKNSSSTKNGFYYTSTNLRTWTRHSFPTDVRACHDIKYLENGVFVAHVYFDSSRPRFTFLYSIDNAETWNEYTVSFGNSITNYSGQIIPISYNPQTKVNELIIVNTPVAYYMNITNLNNAVQATIISFAKRAVFREYWNDGTLIELDKSFLLDYAPPLTEGEFVQLYKDKTLNNAWFDARTNPFGFALDQYGNLIYPNTPIRELTIYNQFCYNFEFIDDSNSDGDNVMNYYDPSTSDNGDPNAFHHYIAPAHFNMTVIDDSGKEVEIGIVRSIFPILTKMKRTSQTNYDEVLKINDIIYCKLNPALVTQHRDVRWQIFDSFSGEYYQETYDETLKYRIKENTIYSINVEFTIGNTTYKITKDSAFTSFKKSSNII